MEKEIIAKLYEMYGKELYAYVFSMCRDSMTAEDILQETFCKSIFALPPEHTNMRAWLYKVAKNLCLNYFAKSKRELPTEKEKCGMEDSPLESLIKDEDKRKTAEAVMSLDKRKREILQLQYYAGLGLKEAADIMGISYENARVLSHRAKKELRKYMEAREDDIF